MSFIKFEEERHRYSYDEILLRSVTSVIKELSPEFDALYTSRASAHKKMLGDEEFKRLRKEIFGFDFKPNKDYSFPIFDELCGGGDKVELIQKDILQDWDDSGTKGTAFHKEREEESIKRGEELNPFNNKMYKVITFDKQYDNQVYDMDLFKLPDGYYTELLVYDKALPLEHTVCGTIDRLWIETIDGIRYTMTDDYKTNAKELTEAKFNRMLPPLSHLWENKITNYSLQASWYQMMLNSHGFTPLNAAFTWYKDYDVNQSKMYPVIVMKNEINLIREYILENLKGSI